MWHNLSGLIVLLRFLSGSCGAGSFSLCAGSVGLCAFGCDLHVCNETSMSRLFPFPSADKWHGDGGEGISFFFVSGNVAWRRESPAWAALTEVWQSGHLQADAIHVESVTIWIESKDQGYDRS